MLNKDKERQLAYVVRVDDVKPIIGKDRVECAVVNGWTIMVKRDQFKPGDLGIYFEIDSKVPEKEPFMFLAQKHFKIKTQKYGLKDEQGNKCGQFWSQGLLMHPSDFGWMYNVAESNKDCVIDTNNKVHYVDDESRFLTKELEVVYSVEEDNKRKAGSADKYKKMAQRRPKLFSKPLFRWLMRRDWGKKLLFVFFGKAKDKKSGWPAWVQKTDEERVENIPHIFANKDPWIATEKIDGTSTTFTMKRGKGNKYEFYICSRNVVFDKPDKGCYYDTNVYTEMAQRYNVEPVLHKLLMDNPSWDWVTLQGETYGQGIQKRDYSMKEHNFMGFNFITSETGRWNSCEAEKLMLSCGIPWVPIVNEEYILPDTIEELRDFVNSETSRVDGLMREGIVFRSLDGSKSFKCVSPDFLMKYHN